MFIIEQYISKLFLGCDFWILLDIELTLSILNCWKFLSFISDVYFELVFFVGLDPIWLSPSINYD